MSKLLYAHQLWTIGASKKVEIERQGCELKLIAEKVIGNREGRIEPRAIKKRNNAYPLLMKPRDIAKAYVLENGHPKKK